MRLEMASFEVNDLELTDRSEYVDGLLRVDLDEVRRLAMENEDFADVSVHVARPRDRTRLIHAFDAAEPRYKPDGGSTFPGYYGPVELVGAGRTHRLGGVEVVTTTGPVAGDPTYDTEAIIDMSGPAAELTPLSRTVNLVLDLTPHEKYLRADAAEAEIHAVSSGSLLSQAYKRQVRTAELKVAAYLARITEGQHPSRVDGYERSTGDLPRVAYLLHIHRIPGIYGARLQSTLPTLMHPNELLDGAFVSGRHREGCSRDATYFYQNPSIVSELYRRHGVDLDFVGVVLFTGGPDMDTKRLATEHAYKLLKMLDVQAVCATSYTSGNPWVEFMMLCQRCERGGIKTVLVMPEEVGAPDDHGFSHYVPEATAIVSTGRGTHRIEIPRMSTVIGGNELYQVSDPPAGPASVPYTYIFGASSNIGQSWLTAREY